MTRLMISVKLKPKLSSSRSLDQAQAHDKARAQTRPRQQAQGLARNQWQTHDQWLRAWLVINGRAWLVINGRFMMRNLLLVHWLPPVCVLSSSSYVISGLFLRRIIDCVRGVALLRGDLSKWEGSGAYHRAYEG